jgi:hypothetical protein
LVEFGVYMRNLAARLRDTLSPFAGTGDIVFWGGFLISSDETVGLRAEIS